MKDQTVSKNKTRGKWELDEVNRNTILGYVEDEAFAEVICEINDTLPKKEVESNIKLITSAPEMLSVLKAVNKYNWDCNQGRLDDSHKRNMRFDAIWYLVQRVLERMGEYEEYPVEEEVA